MEGVKDIPSMTPNNSLSSDWKSFPDYMNYLSKRQSEMDFGAQIPHTALRVYEKG